MPLKVLGLMAVVERHCALATAKWSVNGPTIYQNKAVVKKGESISPVESTSSTARTNHEGLVRDRRRRRPAPAKAKGNPDVDVKMIAGRTQPGPHSGG